MKAKTTTVTETGRAKLDQRAARTRHPSTRPRSGAACPPKRPDGAAGPRRAAGARAGAPAPLDAYLLGAVIAVLTLLGLVMVLSASSVTALHVDGSSWTYFGKQAVWTVLGVVALVITTRVPYHLWRRFVPTLLLVSFGLMVLVLVPSIGDEVNGARAWFSFGPSGSSRPSS